jgi:formate C-acetyltransferase
MARDHYDASVTFDELQAVAAELEEDYREDERITPSEIYRVLECHFSFDYGEDARRNLRELPWFVSNHLHLKYAKALEGGLGAILATIEEKRAVAGPEKREFYDSVEIAVRAAAGFIRRYAETLRTEADRLTGLPARARELREMAAVCEKVAEGSPETFREAVQLTWLLHVIANIGGGSAMSLGRLDQYLGPFYERDVAAGRVTREEAKELLTCCWLKVNEPKMRTVQSVALGGLTPEGTDGTNGLTVICLEIAKETGEPYPNTCLRIHAGTPERVWDRAIETLMRGTGQPMLFNDEAMISNLVASGVPVEDAREYYPMGCVEVMLAGMQPTYQGAGGIELAGLVETVFNNGRANLAGETGVETGEVEDLTTWEDFLGAYLRQVEAHVRRGLEAKERSWRDGDGVTFDPFSSALVDDCLEKGLDVCQGGARYTRLFACGQQGLGTAVDSLSAVREFVYKRKLLTLAELKEALETNFAGREPLRMMLEEGTPCFGNDLDEADEIAEKVFETWVETILGFESRIGAIYQPQSFSYHSHVRKGEVTAATPNGRKRGTTYSDGPGPSQGKDVRGPTCLLNSVTRMAVSKLTGGCAFNMKINPDFVRSDEGREKLKGLLRTYLENGGMQIQVNLVDRATLERAQEHPEQYRSVVVRVAGYCEYFTSLDRKLQDEIIRRTAQPV